MTKTKRNNIIIAVSALLIYLLAQQGENFVEDAAVSSGNTATLQALYTEKQSDVQVQEAGVVKKVLQDDRKGLQHQKFILQTSPEQTVLIAHNIDVAKRLPGIKKGDRVEFYGEYEWTAQGGVIHWTHRDPGGRHINGWLKYNGKKYQ